MTGPFPLAAALLVAVGLCAAPAVHAADLTVTFKGFKAKSGSVMVALAAGETAYDIGPASAQAMVKVDGDTATTVFKGLAPGRYGIKAFHDVDGDGKMATNPFGMPTEPFAFSNNAHGAMGPAKWADAGFEVVEGANVQTIDID
jgi:uncharacterized protein (DUF2141 family)